MKKILMGVLLVVSVSIGALDHGLISGFEIGYNIYDRLYITFEEETYKARKYDNSLSLKIISGYRIGNLRVLGIYKNTLYPIKIDRYNPVQDNYKLLITYKFKNIEIGFSHYCDHPVIPNNDSRVFHINEANRKLFLKYYKEF